MNQGQNGMGMDEAMLDYMLEMGALTPEQEAVARQRKIVDELRGMSQQPRDGRQVGRVYVASNPLEHIAGAVGQGLASYKERGANAAAKGLQDKKLAGIKGMRDRWAAQRAPKMPTAFPQRPLPGEDDPLADPFYGYASPL
jgi:hypothetical protein